MSLSYIREMFGVPARRGARVEYMDQGKARLGTIRSARDGLLRVKLDDAKDVRAFHPCWNMRYLDSSAATGAQAASTPQKENPVGNESEMDPEQAKASTEAAIPLKDEDEEKYEEYLAEIDALHPKHDRTSCDDNDLYNRGFVLLPPRCARCEALSQLKAWRTAHEHALLKVMLSHAQQALQMRVQADAANKAAKKPGRARR